MLNARNVTKRFGELTALSHVNLSLKKGEIYALIGPNGSGKTTLVKIIAGLLPATGGSIKIDKFDIASSPVEAKSLMGYIPDDPRVWSMMTGEEYLRFAGTLWGMGKQQIDKELPELLSLFKLYDIKDYYFEDYSRGNKQKFSILGSLIHSPRPLEWICWVKAF